MVADITHTLGQIVEKVSISLGLAGTNDQPSIEFDVLLDDAVHYSSWCQQREIVIDLSLADTPGTHKLEIIMRGKTGDHTVCDAAGNILRDSSILVQKFMIEQIDMLPIFCQGSPCYVHNQNDSQAPEIIDEFYGFIGCNGRVTFEFYTPIYLWMSEHF